MDGESVFFGINGHRAEAKFVRGPKDSGGDFTAVGDEEFADGLNAHRRPQSASRYLFGKGFPALGAS